MGQVYDRYTDTGGNFHYTDVMTGCYVIPKIPISNNSNIKEVKTMAEYKFYTYSFTLTGEIKCCDDDDVIERQLENLQNILYKEDD